MKRAFTVRAIWDEEAGVYVCESDIEGLHIEAPTLDEFEDIMRDEASELIASNHYSAFDLANTPLKDLIPAIVFERPASPAAA